MKKFYESPDVEKCILTAQESLMNEPSVSGGGYGWSDNGPVEPVE